MSLFKAIRVLLLLLVLVIVAGNHWLGKARLAAWDGPIWVTVYPIPADSKPETRRYAEQLTADSFREVSTFFSQQAGRFGKDLPRAARFQVAPVLDHLPPALPDDGNRFAIGVWSLKMRWWAWRRGSQDGLITPDIQVFMLLRSQEGSPGLDRSVGIQKGRYTLVNGYASRGQAARNRFVMAHELLHVLGASDKYEPVTGQPIAPDGLGNPRANPLFPQSHAEIMAGAIALSPREARHPASLSRVVVGALTAREIGWLD